MSIIASLQNLSGFTRIQASSTPAAAFQNYAPVDIEARIESLRARSQLLSLYSKLESLAEAAGVQTRLNFGAASAASTNGLSLDLTETAATLASSDEINSAAMSFSPFGPDWSGTSSALITVGGVYDGTHGSGDLTFEARNSGTRGETDLRIRVYDPEGNSIRNFRVRTNHALDRQYDLRNGLFATVGSGAIVNRETAGIQLRDDLGAAVNADNPLGGIRNENPNLEFGGPSIVDGQFSINGEAIAVATTDSLNDVVNRINLSAAGVTAAFNALTERIDLAYNQTGSAGVIDLQSDDSNFLAAMKLDSANTIDGIDPENRVAFDQVAAFTTVSSGNITINDTEIAVDTATDSLESVIARINASDAGVVASFDTASQRFEINTLGESGRLSINENDTGLFAALNLLESNDYGEIGGRGFSKKNAYRIADSIAAVFGDLNEVFKGSVNTSAPLISALRGVLGESFGSETFGLTFTDSADARRRGDFATIDRRNLTSSLQRRGDSVSALLDDGNGRSGLINGLLLATRQALSTVNASLKIRDSVVDTFA